MPKRTNDFQKLVALIEKALAPEGATVTESAPVSAGPRRKVREVDVLIESALGPYQIKIAVEAKDEQRKMDLTKFESLLGKYRQSAGVQVDRLVIVTRQGFTSEVAEAAKEANVTLLTLQRAMDLDWAEEICRDVVVSLEPHIARIEFPDLAIQQEGPAVVHQGIITCTCCGRVHGTPFELATKVLRDGEFREALQVAASRAGGQACRIGEWKFGSKLRITVGNRSYSIHSMKVHFHSTYARGKLKNEAYKRGDQVVHHLSGDVAAQHIEIVVPNHFQPHQIGFRIGPAKMPTSPESGHGTDVSIQRAWSVPPRWNGWIQRLEGRLQSVDAQVEVNGIVHNYANGKDYSVPVVVKCCLGGIEYIRTGILFADSFTKSEFNEVTQAMNGTHLDRVLIITDSKDLSMCRREDSDADRYAMIEVEPTSFVDKAINELAPAFIGLVYELKAMQMEFLTTRQEKLVEDPSKYRLQMAEGEMHFALLHSLIADRVRAATVEQALAQTPQVTRHIETDVTLSIPTREKLAIISDSGDTMPVYWFRGNAKARLRIGVLTEFSIGNVGHCQEFVLAAQSPFNFSVSTGALPRRESWNVSQCEPSIPDVHSEVTLPPSVLPNLLSKDTSIPQDKCRVGMKMTLNEGSAGFALEFVRQKGIPEYLRRLAPILRSKPSGAG